MSQTITIRLNKELADWLADTAKRAGVPQGKLVRDQLEKAKASTGSDGTTTHRGYYGSYSRTEVKTTTLEIQLRNMAHVPGTFDLEWIFFGRNGARRFIYDVGTDKVELPGGGFKIAVAHSNELESSKYRGYYYQYRSGDRPDGWLVRAKIGEEVIRTKASSPQIETLGQSKTQLERMMKEYQGSSRSKD